MFNDNGHLSNLKTYNMDSIRIYEKMTLSLFLSKDESLLFELMSYTVLIFSHLRIHKLN